MRLTHPQVGAIPIDSAHARFTVWAPLHDRVSLYFPDRNRAEPMQPVEDGYHILETRAHQGTLYQFQFPDGRTRPDPASRAQPHGVHGPSMVAAVDPPATQFLNPPLDRHVLYELHVGAFTPEGTFDAIVPRLPELRDLGVTALELMPIGQFPGDRNWGYDGVDLFAAQSSYGGLPGLLRLVEACHCHKIAVVLDVVYNHLGPEGNYLAEFGPYFTDRYKTPWGQAVNFDGPDSDPVREFFIQNSLHWTRDCRIDGLRLDAVHAIVDHTASTFVEELGDRVHAAAEQQGRRVFVVAESSDNDPRLVRPCAAGGMGLDGCWNDDYHHAVRAALTGENRGYYRSFGRTSQIAKALQDRYVFTGEYSSSFRRRHGAPARDVDHSRFVVFTQNHDQVGNRPFGDRLDATAGLDGARVAAALVLLSPFTPLLWMGEEHAETAPFLYFVSHTDAALVEAVRRGRAEEFAAFHPGQELPDPQSEATFRRSKIDWGLRGHGTHAAMLAYYAELLRLRREHITGRGGARVSADAQGSIIILRFEGGDDLIVAANTSDHSAQAVFWDDSRGPTAGWKLLLDSGESRWGGAGRSAEIDGSGVLRIEARTAAMLTATRVYE